MSTDGQIQTRTERCACGNSYTQRGVECLGAAIWSPHRCDACQAALEAEVEAKVAARSDHAAVIRREQAARDLAVPPIYRAATFESFQFHGDRSSREAQARVVQILRRYAGTWPDVEGIMMFAGRPGTGKGHMVWSLARALTAIGVRVKVVKLADMIRELRAGWRDKDAKSEDEVLGYYRRQELLVIDEVSRHAFYGQQIHQHLYDVLDHRLEHARPTILTTNEDDAGIAEILGPALLDRLQGAGGILEFGEASWRSRPREVA